MDNCITVVSDILVFLFENAGVRYSWALKTSVVLRRLVGAGTSLYFHLVIYLMRFDKRESERFVLLI